MNEIGQIPSSTLHSNTVCREIYIVDKEWVNESYRLKQRMPEGNFRVSGDLLDESYLSAEEAEAEEYKPDLKDEVEEEKDEEKDEETMEKESVSEEQGEAEEGEPEQDEPEEDEDLIKGVHWFEGPEGQSEEPPSKRKKTETTE